MKKLRKRFWSDAKLLIDWCCDEELRVMRDMVSKEMESRLSKLTGKLDQSEENRKRKGRQRSKKQARGL